MRTTALEREGENKAGEERQSLRVSRVRRSSRNGGREESIVGRVYGIEIKSEGVKAGKRKKWK